ncbi:sulfonate ABC transporter substrate-binding protein, partial [Acinetobacter baumannii]
MALFNSTSWAKYSVIAASLAGVMMLGGCAKKEEHTTTTLNIGYQKYGILPILKARG